MAKKKKRKSSPRRRRASRSSMGGLDIMTPLLTIGGGVGSTLLDRILPSTWDSKMVQGGKILIGTLAPMMFKDAKTKATVTALGAGLAAVAANDLLKDMGLFSGVNDDPDEIEDLAVILPEDNVSENVLGESDYSEYGDMSVINENVLGGDDDMSVINGEEELD